MALDTTVSGPDAEAYNTAAEFAAYALSMGVVISAAETEQEVALRKAAMFLDLSWSWSGVVAIDTQARAFPRDPDTTIPKAIKSAEAELAIRVLAGDDLFSLASARAIKTERVKIEGAVEEAFEYEGGVTGGGAARAFPSVDALVRRYALGLSTASGGASAASIGITK